LSKKTSIAPITPTNAAMTAVAMACLT